VPGQGPQRAGAARSGPRRRSSPRRNSSLAPESFPVVGLGASAGGLDAFRRLLGALPSGTGMAFILIQHLDPTHPSMMVDLLTGHTPLTVQQAADRMPLESEHVYLIPPGTYLSIRGGALHLSEPRERHGARLPFDFFLRSLAEELGDRSICVILSGTGTDGSLGLKAVKERGGLVIAQDPDEAEYDGMPRSAIMTGAVDLVLTVAKIPEILAKYGRRQGSAPDDHPPDRSAEIINLLRAKTAHDFALYKPGTLLRRIERRMALAGIDDSGRYLDRLQQDSDELDLLAKDMLINVTSFFRDRAAFELMAENVIPALVRRHPSDRPLRIWVAGCSTGAETYSLAMLLLEAVSAAKRNIKLQVFASDVDEDAVALAREGHYPEAIAADVSPVRLARFFTQEEHGYRVVPELRGVVVFTVQDVLADPPFSRLDLISCRNLLIYLRPEAQEKVLLLFHFAFRRRHPDARRLRDGGQPRRPVRADLQSAADLSADRPQPARGSRFSDRFGRGRASDLAGRIAPRGGAGHQRQRPHPPAVGRDLCAGFGSDDDSAVREALRDLLREDGRSVEIYDSSEAFLAAYQPGGEGCLLVDARMPGMGGLELLHRLKSDGTRLPAIMITGQGDVPMAVETMRAGAADFIEKPIRRDELFASIEHALEHVRDVTKLSGRQEAAATRLAGLTARQREIMELVLAGHPSKNIAADLGISQRTVENHRAAVMKRTGSRSLSALIRLALAAHPATAPQSPG
jgi:FixJ family two-component response regulator/chemotaxis methyl-accepting protein methylase